MEEKEKEEEEEDPGRVSPLTPHFTSPLVSKGREEDEVTTPSWCVAGVRGEIIHHGAQLTRSRHNNYNTGAKREKRGRRVKDQITRETNHTQRHFHGAKRRENRRIGKETRNFLN